MSRTPLPFRSAWAVVLASAIGLLVAHGTGQGACSPGNLFAFASYADAGMYSVWPAPGDFNGDGYTDLAVSNLNSNTVSVFLGRGDGTFTAPTSVPAGSGPARVVAHDFDGDGILDLAVTNLGPATVTFLRGLGTGGRGNGSFASAITYAAGPENRGLAVADLNGDGHPDLVVAGTAKVAVLLNRFDGTRWGTFATPILYTTPSAWGVGIADFNGDGNLDVAAGSYLTADMSILLGLGDGTFQPGTSFTLPGGCTDVIPRDLNGDAIPDLVAPGRGGVWVMLGNGLGGHGNGTFQVASYDLSGHTHNGAALADANADGKLDIIATDADGNRAVVLPGNGDGTFGSADGYQVGTGPIGVASFDANGDFATDLFVVCSASLGYPGAVATLMGRCHGDVAPRIAAVQDVRGDEGGKVFVAWLRSVLDTPTIHLITDYRVWRRVRLGPDATRAVTALASFDPERDLMYERHQVGPDGVQVVDYWEPVATIPAAFLEGYAYTATTLSDSTRHANPYTAFFIQALTAVSTEFYNSPVDSGYSVDNIRPKRPEPFVGQYANGSARLHWLPNPEADLSCYNLYRGSTPDFVPDASSLIVTKPDTGWVDPAGAPACYKLSAVDVHDNESDFAVLLPTGTTDVPGDAVAFGLQGFRPNPASGVLSIAFSLPQAAPAFFEVLDLAGRRIAVREVGSLGTGRHVVNLAEGARIPPGIYVIRLTQGGRSLTVRGTVVR